MEFSLLPVPFDELEGWKDDDPSSLFAVMANCLRHVRDVKPYKTGSLGVTSEELADVFAAAAGVFAQKSRPKHVPSSNRHSSPSSLTLGWQCGLRHRLLRTRGRGRSRTVRRIPISLLSPARQMVDIDGNNRPEGLTGATLSHARPRKASATAPPGRAIDKASRRQGLESPGPGRRSTSSSPMSGAQQGYWSIPTARIQRITYAAKAGHPFHGHRPLSRRYRRGQRTFRYQSIRAWLADHPERGDQVLWQNRSYIFFREAPVEGLSEHGRRCGRGAAGSDALAGRGSPDPTFSSPFFIRSASAHPSHGRQYSPASRGARYRHAIVRSGTR